MRKHTVLIGFVSRVRFALVILSLSVLAALGVLPAVAAAQPIAPGFTVQPYATVTQPTSLAFGPGGAFGTDLYVGSLAVSPTASDEIVRIPSAGVVNPFATLLPEADPVALAFPPAGSPFTSALYVSANNRDNGANGDCGGAIQRVDAAGNVTDFTSLTSSFACPTLPPAQVTALGEPSGIAFGPGGGFGTDLYVANSSDVPADIVRVNASGGTTNFVKFTTRELSWYARLPPGPAPAGLIPPPPTP
jgi:hypothetical protein